MSTKQLSPEEQFEAAFAEAAALRGGDEQQTQPETPPAEPQAAPEGQEQQPTEAAKDEGQPAVQEPEQDPVEALKKQLAEAVHRERSASSRISSFHKKLNEAEARIAELQRQVEAANKPPAAPAEDDPDMKAVLSEMPEIGKVVDRLVAKKVAEAVEPLNQRVQQVDQAVAPVRDFAQEQAVRRELAVVEKEFPNWREIVFSPEYEQWVASKPQAIRDAYDKAETGADALEFLRMYRREKGAPAPQPAAPSVDPKLARAVGIPARPQAAQLNGMPPEDDFEAAFSYFAKQRRKQLATIR